MSRQQSLFEDEVSHPGFEAGPNPRRLRATGSSEGGAPPVSPAGSRTCSVDFDRSFDIMQKIRERAQELKHPISRDNLELKPRDQRLTETNL